jgi:hypothetical protein
MHSITSQQSEYTFSISYIKCIKLYKSKLSLSCTIVSQIIFIKLHNVFDYYAYNSNLV